MQMRTTICDMCGKECTTVVRSRVTKGDFCSVDCMLGTTTVHGEECAHEDNATDEVAGRETMRLVCKDCGYDRVVKVTA